MPEVKIRWGTMDEFNHPPEGPVQVGQDYRIEGNVDHMVGRSKFIRAIPNEGALKEFDYGFQLWRPPGKSSVSVVLRSPNGQKFTFVERPVIVTPASPSDTQGLELFDPTAPLAEDKH